MHVVGLNSFGRVRCRQQLENPAASQLQCRVPYRDRRRPVGSPLLPACLTELKACPGSQAGAINSRNPSYAHQTDHINLLVFLLSSSPSSPPASFTHGSCIHISP